MVKMGHLTLPHCFKASSICNTPQYCNYNCVHLTPTFESYCGSIDPNDRSHSALAVTNTYEVHRSPNISLQSNIMKQ